MTLKHCLIVSSLFAGSLAACGGDGPKEPVTLGMSVSLTGPDAEFGATMKAVATAAVDTINAAGGADGHQIELIAVDDETTEEGAAAAVDSLVEQGAVAIIGPFNSGPVEAALPAAIAAETPILSPSSTAPRLALPTADQGYLFRTVPNVNFQVLAMSRYFVALATPTVDDILIVHEDSTYGNGLADALESDWTDVRHNTLTAAQMTYTPDPDFTQVSADDLWTQINAAAPTAVVVIGLGTDINILLRTWITSGQLPDLQWFFSDSVKATSVFGTAGTADALPAAANGLRGTAPTSPKLSVAFSTFVDAVAENEGINVTDQAYTPNTWDAVYLTAAALVQQSVDGQPFGGAALRDELSDVSQDGQTYDAGSWRDLVSQIRSGGDVDYDGASGPVDFTTEGEVLSPYEVWEMQLTGATWTFAQVEYIETTDLQQ
jgi:ABC-type branched-subunit amino acid transport system substrate-binding protein